MISKHKFSNHFNYNYIIQIVLFVITVITTFQCTPKSKPEISTESNSTTVLPGAFVGEEYSVALKVDSIKSPLIWHLDKSDSFPDGLVFDSINGIIKGIPKYDGTHELKVYIAEASKSKKWFQSTFILQINDDQVNRGYSQLQIISPSPLPFAYVDNRYEVKLAARGSKNPIIWKSEILPDSLVLDPQTGIIKGIPYDKGRFCINIYAYEQNDTTKKDEKSFGLVVRDKLEQKLDNNDLTPRLTDQALARLECGSVVFNPPKIMEVGERRDVSLYLSLDLSNKEIKEEIIKRTNLRKSLEAIDDKKVDVSKVEKSIGNLENKIINEEKGEVDISQEEFQSIAKEVEGLENQGVPREDIKKAVNNLKESINEIRNIVVSGRLLSANVRLTNQMKAKLSGSAFKIELISDEIQTISAIGITEWKWNVTALEPKMQKLRLELSAIINQNGNVAPLLIQTFEKEIDVDITPIIRIRNFYDSNWEWIWGTLLLPLILWLGRLFINRIKSNQNKK